MKELRDYLKIHKGKLEFPVSEIPIASKWDRWYPKLLKKLIVEKEQEALKKDPNFKGFKVAIIIPIRGRCSQVRYIIPYLHYFLQNRKGFYRIFIVEQTHHNRFNKAMLLNTGVLLANREAKHNGLEEFDYYVFNDVDMLPVDSGNSYSYSPFVVHRAVFRTKPIFRSKKNPDSVKLDGVSVPFFETNQYYYGGIIQFSAEVFQFINGFSNGFWGWGEEDSDMYNRFGFYYVPRKIASFWNPLTLLRPGVEDGKIWEFPRSTSKHDDLDHAINVEISDLMWKNEKIEKKYLPSVVVEKNGIKQIVDDGDSGDKFYVVYRKETDCMTYLSVNLDVEESETLRWGYFEAFELRKRRMYQAMGISSPKLKIKEPEINKK